MIRELDFAVYAQDDWKVTPKLTLNLGLRYQPTTNPVEVHNLLSAITNFATATSFSSVPNAFQSNPSLTNSANAAKSCSTASRRAAASSRKR